MPLYEYECQACHFRFEKLQRLSDPPPPKCPECGGKIAQMMSTSSVQFKGSGWYVTDYQRKGSGGDSKGEKKAESKAETKSETKGETKSETKGETKTKTETKSDSKGAKEKK
ncbi:MAG: zinc ribbon domain-containing protein [Acidobacteriia bacterium]|nr:zinc ribbon domain-containing protein [Terriglobia bacterium]